MKRSDPSPNCGAFTFVGLLIIIAIIAILAALLLPALARAKQRAQRINCVSNLKQVGLAFRIWGGDHDDKFPMAVPASEDGTLEWVAGGNAFRHFQVMSNELNATKILVCPADTRQPARNFELLGNENLSYFVGLDAVDTAPTMLLSGDRNLTNGLSPVRTVLSLRPDRPAGWTERMHRDEGNIGFVDGSVRTLTTPELRTALRRTGDSTNRIALPE